MIEQTQASLRRAALAARRELPPEQRRRASKLVCETFLRSGLFLSARSIAVYLPADDEVDTSEIILRGWRAKKRIFAPVVDRNRKLRFCELRPESVLRRNRYGLFEPESGERIAARELDVVLTPVVAFDRHRQRIGMGGGYFDRCFNFLLHRHVWLRPKLVGLAFENQEVEKIPGNPWDIRLYRVIAA